MWGNESALHMVPAPDQTVTLEEINAYLKKEVQIS